ncbi:GMC family oxidoreductase N-terminal domain-containing protein [Mesorhizobium sp. BAC0120]|uniref:GMC family oxidoreductase n=1 Tax=Mesorhizobium sp. BAC0120 TaxID=3090670 RepID=UPI00298CE0F3|nr:GMC family oxidoreductase N-terminal domain-containing protein [Mesorhizobium sp. BAC0120]MDW6021117.1 GMC family oxidoreductase N-terminal domain-containing protein [Mesorhizobium sp. BAC0120]
MEFDYIVVGSGSAGSPLAARLVERGASVLLLEAGKREKLHLTRVPAALMHTIGNKRYDWNYVTEPDPTRNGLQESWPRGRVPGGSSAINGMIFIRGAAADYDAWEAMGNKGWGWNSVLPYFRKMETADEDKDNAFRGGMGPLRVSALRWKHPISAKFIDSFVNAGVPLNPDLNGRSHEGVAWNQGSTRGGVRHSAFDAFVLPRLKDSKLTFMDDALVERIVLDGKRARGVDVVRGGQRIRATARRGVVLSAGSINSPQILMISGIGDPAELKRHGIEVRVASPDVGRNLMEHPGLYVRAEMDIKTGNAYASPLGRVRAFAEWALSRKGVLSVPTAQVLAFLRSTQDQEVPDLQFHLFPFGYFSNDGRLQVPTRNLVTILANVNYPKSTGHLELRSSDPRTPVAIYPRLLDHADDLECVLRGLDWIRRLASTPPFGSHVRELLDVPPQAAGRSADEEYVRKATVPFLHPVGTCRMGVDDRAVVAPDLRVRGVEGLWVADASIFPRHIAGNTNATAIMIGERAADLIHP